jgi:hypothetical protein
MKKLGDRTMRMKKSGDKRAKTQKTHTYSSNDGRFSNKLHPWAQHHDRGLGGFISQPA